MALFENFPYTNIHELNLDWIVKIAKDFLEQYTHIQQLISDGETSLTNLTETGLASLQEKADALEAALQAWYDTHSEDIAQELADALADLNAWYTQHENYLDQTLQTNTDIFNQRAATRTAEAIQSIPSDYTEFYEMALKSTTLLGYAASVLSSADNAQANTIYKVVTSDMSLYPANMPAVFSGYLLTYRWKAQNANQYFWTQIATDNDFNAMYIRTKTVVNGSGAYTDWKDAVSANILPSVLKIPTNNMLLKYTRVDGKYTDRSNGAIGTNPNYEYIPVPVTAGYTYKLMNSTSSTVAFYNSATFNTVTFVSGLVLYEGEFTVPEGATHASISHNKKEKNIWMGLPSQYTPIGLENDWKENPVIYVEKNNTGDFVRLTDALNYAMNHKNTTVYLGAGDWNIIDELGAAYFENFTYEAYSNMGPKIGNGLHLIGTPKSRILCHYQGTNNQVKRNFSVFAAVSDNVKEYGNFTLEGITIQASNIEYCVHDDVGIQTVHAIHNYINCTFSLDNSNNSVYGNHRGIGGGLGVQTTINIQNCLFGGLGSTDDISLSYHNDHYSGSPQSSIVINACCFTGRNTLEINAYGTQTEKTLVKVSNNLLGTQMHKNINEGVDNIDLFQWNNSIRYEN